MQQYEKNAIEHAIEQMKRALGDYYLEGGRKEEWEDKEFVRYKQRSEKPIPLVTNFWFNKNEYNTNIPVPFVRLWLKISEVFCGVEGYDSFGKFWNVNQTTVVSHFWRLYSVYRHGGSYKIALEQIERSCPEIKEFWEEQLPLLTKEIYPYMIVNRYIIMPINRTINFCRRINK